MRKITLAIKLVFRYTEAGPGRNVSSEVFVAIAVTYAAWAWAGTVSCRNLGSTSTSETKTLCSQPSLQTVVGSEIEK